MYANLFGDFVKGSKFDNFSEKTQNGIRLHRKIDHFIDNHPKVLELRKILSPNLPKVSGIAIDIYFDHLLAKNWNQFHASDYQTFLNAFFEYNHLSDDVYPTNFNIFIATLKHHQWIRHYGSFWGLEKMSEGISKRISFPNKLAIAPDFFQIHEKEIENTFEEFMRDATDNFGLTNK